MFYFFSFLESGYKLYRYRNYTTACDLLTSYRTCLAVRGPMLASVHVCGSALLALVLERLASTY